MPPNSRPSSGSSIKNITIGQITDSVIAKDFATNSMFSHRPYGGSFHHESMGAPDHQWTRRLPMGVPVSQPSTSRELKEPSGRVPTPDDRQIIRMAQTPSPRAKGGSNVPIHEPVSSPDDSSGPNGGSGGGGGVPVSMPTHYYSSVGQTSISLQPLHGGPPPPDRRPHSGPPTSSHSGGSGPQTSSHQTSFVLDCYVKNRIVEEMRIQEKGGGERAAGVLGNPHDRSSTPGAEDEMRPNSRTSAPPLGPPYGSGGNQTTATTVAYPYSAWNVSGAPSGNHVAPPAMHKGLDGHPMNSGPAGGNTIGGTGAGGSSSSGPGANSTGGGGGVATSGAHAEPKPLLSSQYEELSDEDDGNGN